MVGARRAAHEPKRPDPGRRPRNGEVDGTLGRLVDRLVWFQGPLVIGADGRPAVAELGIEALAACPSFQRSHGRTLAPDTVQVYIVNTA